MKFVPLLAFLIARQIAILTEPSSLVMAEAKDNSVIFMYFQD